MTYYLVKILELMFVTKLEFSQTRLLLGPWWWSSGQRLAFCSDDPSLIPMQATKFVQKAENKGKRVRGWPTFKKLDSCYFKRKFEIKTRL